MCVQNYYFWKDSSATGIEIDKFDSNVKRLYLFYVNTVYFTVLIRR